MFDIGYSLQRILVIGLAIAIAGCGGSSSNSDNAPPVAAPSALAGVTTDSTSSATPPSQIVATFNSAASVWSSALFSVTGTCTTLPTSSVAVDPTGKILTVTLAGGVCTAGQTLTLTLDPTAITFVPAVTDSGTVWTRTYTIPSTATHTVGGTITGLTGTLVLTNNSGAARTISTDGPFTFTTPIASGGNYSVAVQTQPANQTCSIGNSSGAIGAADVTNVTVTCSTNTRSVGGNVAGLSGTVTLQNNGADSTVINSDGAFIFSMPVAQGSTYAVTVQAQPAGQTCTVSNGSGTVSGANINNVAVTCATNAYTVGGTVSGLSGTVTLQNNGADNTVINSNGSFTFSTPIAEGGSYNVTVQTQPAAQTCSVTNGAGTMGGANVTNVGVNCTTNNTTLSVTATGTIAVNNGSTSLTVTNTGSTYTAYNVAATLPGGWTGVTQDASNCTAVAPGDTCTLTFTSTTPYVAQGNISVSGDNISSPPTTALAFSLEGYLVWSVSGTSPSATARVLSASNESGGTVPWSPTSNALGVTEASSSPCNGATDGACNTAAIVSFYGTSSNYAAKVCNQKTSDNTGTVAAGTWYLPAICEWGAAGGLANCPSGLANIGTNLYQLQFASLSVYYWSSTEDDFDASNNAWEPQFVSSAPDHQASASKNFNLAIRCARTISY